MSFEYTNQQIELRIKFQDELVEKQVWQCCLNCTEFEENSENCKRFNARPPAYIIVSGCKDYCQDIPF